MWCWVGPDGVVTRRDLFFCCWSNNNLIVLCCVYIIAIGSSLHAVVLRARLSDWFDSFIHSDSFILVHLWSIDDDLSTRLTQKESSSRSLQSCRIFPGIFWVCFVCVVKNIQSDQSQLNLSHCFNREWMGWMNQNQSSINQIWIESNRIESIKSFIHSFQLLAIRRPAPVVQEHSRAWHLVTFRFRQVSESSRVSLFRGESSQSAILKGQSSCFGFELESSQSSLVLSKRRNVQQYG